MAGELMRTHRLTGWTFAFDRAKTRAGQCRFDRREISLSRHLTALHSADQVRDTVLHEIAHALAGPKQGHGPAWQEVAIRVGAQPHRTLGADAPLPAAPWQGHCPGGHRHRRYRRPQRPVSCGLCCRRFCLANMVVWKLHGRHADLGPSYQRALERAAGAPSCHACG